MDPLSRFRPCVGREQIDFAAPAAGGDDHAFAQAELHLPRGEVGGTNHQPADQMLRLVDALDAGEHRAAIVAAEAQA